MRFMKLKLYYPYEADTCVIINVKHVTAIYRKPDDKFTTVDTRDGNDYCVCEMPEEILEEIARHHRTDV